MSGLRKRNRRDLLGFLLRYNIALYPHAWSHKNGQAAAESTHKAIRGLLSDVEDTLRPGARSRAEAAERAAARASVRSWESRYGDLNDPEVQAKVAKFAEAMEQLRRQTAETMKKQASSQLGYMSRELGLP